MVLVAIIVAMLAVVEEVTVLATMVCSDDNFVKLHFVSPTYLPVYQFTFSRDKRDQNITFQTDTNASTSQTQS